MKLTPLGGVSVDLKELQAASTVQEQKVPGEGGDPGAQALYTFDVIVHGQTINISATDKATADGYHKTAIDKLAHPLYYGGYTFSPHDVTAIGAVSATTDKVDGPSEFIVWVAGAHMVLAFPTHAEADEARKAVSKAVNEA